MRYIAQVNKGLLEPKHFPSGLGVFVIQGQPFSVSQLNQSKSIAHVASDAIDEVAGNHWHLETVDWMATAGTIVLEIKIAIDIVLAEDGKFYVDVVTMKSGDTAQEWTEGPFDTEAKARETLKWQVAVPVIEKL